MPKRAAVTSFEERVSESFLEDIQNVAARIASEEGDPPGAGKVSDKEAVRLWGIADQRAPYDEMMARITTTGIPEAELGDMMIVQEVPDLAEMYAQPQQDEEIAHMLAKLAEYPFRWGLVIDFSDDPDEQVRRADHLDGMWQKGKAPMPEPPAPVAPQMPPDPMMAQQPAPQMPPAAAPPTMPDPAAMPPMMGG